MTTQLDAPVQVPEARRRVNRRAVLVCILWFLLVVAALAVWGLVEARSILKAAPEIESAQQALMSHLQDQDWAAARADADRLTAAAAAARSATGSVPLRLASEVPVLGRNVDAAGVLAVALDDVANEAVQPLVSTLEGGTSLLTADGGVDVAALRTMAPQAQSANAVIGHAAASVKAIDADDLLAPFQDKVRSAQESIDILARHARTLSTTITTLPGMLGADGPRRYLLAVQNPAEARPTGGIIGAWAVVAADQGRISLLGNGVNNDLSVEHNDDLTVSDQARALFGRQIDVLANFNLSPHFPQAAELFAQHVEQVVGGPPIDGVVAMDPVVLGSVLEVTGSVDSPVGAVTGANAAELLMSALYVSISESDQRDDYVRDITQSIFAKLIAPGVDLVTLGRTLTRDDVRPHVLVWSRITAEQDYLRGIGLAQELPPPAIDRVGVFVTNADASKLDFYLQTEVASTCVGGRPTVSATLTNNAPESLPDYVRNHLEPTPLPGSTHRVIVSVYLPREVGVSSVAIGGQQVGGVSVGDERGWRVLRTSVDLAPGVSTSLDVTLDGAQEPPQDLLTQAFVNPAKVTLGRCS